MLLSLRRKKMSNELVKDDTQLDLATKAVAIITDAEDKPVKTPVDQVEQSVATFLEKAFAATEESHTLAKALEESFVDDIKNGTMSTTEKITLFNIERSSSNDRLFKLISPTSGLITERLRAEIQAAAQKSNQQAAVQVNVGSTNFDSQVASSVPPEVGIGLNALFQAMAARASEKKQE